MTGKSRDPSKLNPEQAARQKRLNAALRANIQRRKAADAAREPDDEGGDGTGESASKA